MDSLTSIHQRHFQFIYHLDGLKGEFEAMAEEVETLRKERDRYKARVEMQAEELQGIRSNLVCNQCKKATTTTHSQSASRITSQPLDTITLHSESVNTPSPSSYPSTSNADPDSSADELLCKSDTFSDDSGKELELEIAYELSHSEGIWCVKFSHDGKHLAAGCRDGLAYIYDVQTGSLTCVLRNLLAEHDSIRAVCFSRDGKYLATSSSDAYIYIWEINSKYVRNVFKGHTDLICSLDFSSNGQLLVSTSYDNTVRLWNLRHGAVKVLADDDHSFLNYDYYRSAKFGPDGKYVAASHYDGAVRIWDVRLGHLIRRVRAHMDLVNDIVFMPDGKGLASGGRDMTLKYWDISSLDVTNFRARSPTTAKYPLSAVEDQIRPERQFIGHEDSVYSLAISPDGKWLASGSDDQSVHIWDTRTTEVECILNCLGNDDNGEVNSVDFDPVGCHLASGGDDGTVRVWSYSLEVPMFSGQ